MPTKHIIIPGTRFGRLVVLEESPVRKYNYVSWRCRCDCGQETIVTGVSLRLGNTRSCGCLQRETAENSRLTHGHSTGYRVTPTYKCWLAMNDRCRNPNNKGYRNYGGRGIMVCERWKTFENFLADMGERPRRGLSIDRRENNLGYAPDNCEWATRAAQSRNRRSNQFVQFNDLNLCVTDWAKKIGITQKALSRRLRLWPLERALTDPSARKNRESSPDPRHKVNT